MVKPTIICGFHCFKHARDWQYDHSLNFTNGSHDVRSQWDSYHWTQWLFLTALLWTPCGWNPETFSSIALGLQQKCSQGWPGRTCRHVPISSLYHSPEECRLSQRRGRHHMILHLVGLWTSVFHLGENYLIFFFELRSAWAGMLIPNWMNGFLIWEGRGCISPTDKKFLYLIFRSWDAITKVPYIIHSLYINISLKQTSKAPWCFFVVVYEGSNKVGIMMRKHKITLEKCNRKKVPYTGGD